jgi:peptidoglycan/LPS O-acetylase OafA/YrhL
VGSRSRARARAKASEAAGRPNSAPSAARAAAVTSTGVTTGTSTGPAATQTSRPTTIVVAAVVEGIEALMVLIAAVLAGVDTGQGKSYQLSSGIAITIIGVVMAGLLGLVAYGLRRPRRWTRTPALLTQLFVGIVGIYLLQGGRYDWGVPAVALALAGFVTLFAPASTRALTAGLPQPEPFRVRRPRG